MTPLPNHPGQKQANRPKGEDMAPKSPVDTAKCHGMSSKSNKNINVLMFKIILFLLKASF